MSEELKLIGEENAYGNHPVCQNLRTKALYIPGGHWKNMVTTNPSSHYWCNCTMLTVGPDDRFVAPENCNASRSCFERIGGTPVV